MYTYDELLHLDLEVSSLCNALCPVCNRRSSGGKKNPMFVETYITLTRFKEWFDDEYVSRLYSLQLCGNYGDAMTNPELIAILTHITTLNPGIIISMNTNASGRNPQFWKDLARLIGSGHLVFSIDGLEDTNYIYRRGTHWEKIMMAATNYIAAGGRAYWDMLIFKHNQHQVKEAEQLSIDMGFIGFSAKKAMGFVSNDINRVVKEEMPVLNEQGKCEYIIEPPTSNTMKNSIIADYVKKSKFSKTKEEDTESVHKLRRFKIDNISKDRDMYEPFIIDNNRELSDWEIKLGNTEITCMVIKPKSVFVSSEGLVFPCCFTASKYYAIDNEETAQLKKFINDYGRDNISMHHRTLKEIIDGPMFQKHWVENFNDNNVRNKRLRTCSLFCGKDTNTELNDTLRSVTSIVHDD